VVLELRHAFKPFPGTGKGKDLRRAGHPPLGALGQKTRVAQALNQSEARLVDLADELEVPLLLRRELPPQIWGLVSS